MLRSAPRYPPALLALLIGLDDERQPIAETCRRVGEAAARLGIERPSYVHLRRLVHRDRRRRREIGERREGVITNLLTGTVPNPYDVLRELVDPEQ